MTWNYRVIRRKHDNGEITFAVHEVYYRDGKPEMWSSEAIPANGDTFYGLARDLAMQQMALKETIFEEFQPDNGSQKLIEVKNPYD